MRKTLSALAMIFSATLFLTSPVIAQDSHSGHDHAGHDHNADDGHSHAPAMSEEELSKIDFVYTQSPDDHVIGKADAPNTMIVYASVTCPHCSDWFIHQYPTLKKDLIDKGKLKMIFREFVTAPQEVAVAGFQLALCGESEDYFDILTYQMEGQEETFTALQEGRAIERFLEIAKLAGIENQEDMFSCFDKKEGFERLERQIDRARAGNIKGVPGVIINGKLVDGDVDALNIKALLP